MDKHKPENLFDYTSIPTIIIDKQHKIVFLNKAVEKLTGIKKEEYIGTDLQWCFFYHKKRPIMADYILDDAPESEIRKIYENNYEKSKLIEGAYEGVAEVKTKTKGTKWVRFAASPLRDETGNIYGAIQTFEDITEKKAGEEALKESEERYRSIFKNMVVGIYQSSFDGKNLTTNDAFAKMLGYGSAQELSAEITDIGKQIYLDSKERGEALKKVRQEGWGVFEMPVKRKDGSKIWITNYLKGVENPKTGEYQINGVAVDDTMRRQAEEALKESEEKYRNIFQNATEGIYQSTPDGRYITVNPSFARMLGYDSPAEITREITNIGEQIYVNPEERLRLKKLLAEKGFVENFEAELFRKDKERIWISLNAHVVKDKEGRISYYEGTNEDITERKKSEKAVEESEKKYRFISENVSDVIWVLDAQTMRFTYVSPSVEKLRGYTAEETMNQSVKDVLSPEAYAFVSENLEKRMAAYAAGDESLKVQTNELAQTKKDGSTVPTEVVTTFLKDETGKVATIVGVSRDITERKKAEEVLQKQRQELERQGTAIEASIVGISIFNKKEEFIYVNKALVTMYGYKDAAELIGKQWKILFTNERVKEREDRVKSELIKRGYWKGEVTGKKADGSTFPQEFFLTALKDGGFVTVVQDITERKKTEEALKESESRWRNLIDDMPAGSAIHRDGIILYANKACWEMGGFKSQEEMIGRNAFDFIHPDYHKIVSERLREMFKSNKSTKVMTQIFLNIRGEPFYVQSTAIPITYMGEKAVLSVFWDISETIKAEEKVSEALKEKELLLKELHHRVKNNLQVVSSRLNLQASTIKNPDCVEVLIEDRNFVKAMSLVHEKLHKSEDLSAIEFGGYLKSLADYLVRSYGLDTDQIKVVVDSDAVFLDINTAIPCGLIVNELVTNALKHAFPNQQKGIIRIELAKRGEGDIALAVSDNGIGFPKDLDLRNADSLGLQIVNTLVKQIRGDIRMETGQGTRFIIDFKIDKQKNGQQ